MNARSLVAGLLMPFALLLGGCGRTDNAAPKQPAQAASTPAAAETKGSVTLSIEEAKAAGIQVQEVQLSDVAATVVLNGTLGANQDRIATILPRLPGRIVSAPVPLGAAVRAGQTLAVIESIDLGDAQSAHRQAASESRVAEAALERAQKLAAEDIIAQKDLQRARGDAERARAALRAAADKLRLLGVSPAPMDSNKDAVYPVTTPLSGTLIDKHAVVGAQVETDALFTVADLSTIWLDADAFEKDLAALKIGSPASVTIAAYPDQAFQGHLTYLSATMDTTSRTVKARVEEKLRALVPGYRMYLASFVVKKAGGARGKLPMHPDPSVVNHGEDIGNFGGTRSTATASRAASSPSTWRWAAASLAARSRSSMGRSRRARQTSP